MAIANTKEKNIKYQSIHMPFTGCQSVIPSNNHPEDTPSFCNDCKLCIELEVENRGSSSRVGVMSAVMLCLLMLFSQKERKKKKEWMTFMTTLSHEMLMLIDSKKERTVFQ